MVRRFLPPVNEVSRSKRLDDLCYPYDAQFVNILIGEFDDHPDDQEQ